MAASSTFVAASGDGYEQQMGRWSRRLAEPFLDFCGCGEGESVLDAGCGTGALSAAILKRTATTRMTGVDFSQAYIDHARRTIPDARAAFDTGDIGALPYDDAAFDRVLSLLVLHFVPDTARAVAELRRVGRPGATIAAAVWDAGGLVSFRMFFDTAVALFPEADARRARNFSRPMTRPGELAAAWRAAGLSEVRDTMLTIRMDFASFDDYWAPFEGRDGPGAEFIATLDAGQTTRLRDAVRAAYLCGQGDGARSFAATAWAVKGIVPD